MLSNVFKVLLSNGLIVVIGLINSFFFPLVLTTTDYATYQQFMLYVSYINICHLGIASGMFLNYAGKQYHEIDKKQYKSEIILISIVLVFFTLIGLGIFSFSKKEILFLVAITIIPQCMIASFQALYQAWGRFTGYSVINILPKLILTIMVIIFFSVGEVSSKKVINTYVVIVWGITIYFVQEFVRDTRATNSNKIFSKQNAVTTWNGFLITMGNYVNILFHSIDKQFVLSIYSKEAFALYSFAMSLQNIMMIFITALANPFYTRLAKKDIDSRQLNILKELLFVFGAYSGCAFFAVSFVVNNFISRYSGAVNTCAMFFAVFPAMAVINVLYINLYKIRKKLRKYIFTLVGMLVLAAVANLIVVALKAEYIYIALATMLCYYIWLFYSKKDFDDIVFAKKDYLYLLGFIITYFLYVAFIKNAIIGCLFFAIFISIWNLLFYKKSISYVIEYFIKKDK